MKKLTKEQFVKIISEIRKNNEYELHVNNVLGEIFTDGSGFPKNDGLLTELIDLLKFIMNDKEDIEYFIYDLNYGEDWKPGMIMDGDKDIDLSSAEKLYEYLTSK